MSTSAAGAASSALPASGEACVLVRVRVRVWASACSPSQRRHPRCTGRRGLGMRTVRYARRWHRNEALRLGTQGAQEAGAVRVRCGPYAHSRSVQGAHCQHGARPRLQPLPAHRAARRLARAAAAELCWRAAQGAAQARRRGVAAASQPSVRSGEALRTQAGPPNPPWRPPCRPSCRARRAARGGTQGV